MIGPRSAGDERRAGSGRSAAVRTGVMALAPLLAACSSAPPPPDWRLDARDALASFERYYLEGESQLAEREFESAKGAIARSGRGDLLARAELVRCAVRIASLEYGGCPGFEALRADAGPEELAYAAYLSGTGSHATSEEPLSQLVSAGVQFQAGTITPAGIAAAAQIASSQGWRRPLLAWLGVLAKRASDAGDQEAVARIQRRIDIVTGRPPSN